MLSRKCFLDWLGGLKSIESSAVTVVESRISVVGAGSLDSMFGMLRYMGVQGSFRAEDGVTCPSAGDEMVRSITDVGFQECLFPSRANRGGLS